MVFMFGLLHGMGFAGVLTNLHLERTDFAVALLGFNLGVEGGQLTVIAGAALLVGGGAAACGIGHGWSCPCRWPLPRSAFIGR